MTLNDNEFGIFGKFQFSKRTCERTHQPSFIHTLAWMKLPSLSALHDACKCFFFDSDSFSLESYVHLCLKPKVIFSKKNQGIFLKKAQGNL